MQKTVLSIFTVLMVIFLSGCTNRNVNINPEIEKSLLQPESIDVYGIDINKLVVEKDNLRDQVKEFPFVSLNPVLDYRGKFSDKFYSLKPYKVRAKRIDEIDFWKLQNNPYSVDFIYVLPIWVENFKRVSDDLYQNIGYSYNLSIKEQEILKWWVEQGGVLWLETGIYTTLYDSYTKTGVTSSSKAKKVLNKKSEKQFFMDKNLHIIKYQANKIDYINYEKREVPFSVNSELPWLNGVEKLRLVINNYAENYFLPEGKVLLKTSKNIPLVTSNRYGKGMILSMVPFSYNDTRFDGELLRWKLIEYALDTTVLKKDDLKVVYDKEESQKVLMKEDVNETKKEVETKAPIKEEVKIIDMRDNKSTMTAYCVQLYSDGSEASFNRTLYAHKNLKNIRGEIRGSYYVIRAGKYDNYNDAANDLSYYQNYFNDAFVRECAYKN